MILVLDTETTGLPPNGVRSLTEINNWPRLVQLAYLLCDVNGKIKEEGNFLIKPKGFLIPETASIIHGITTKRAIENGYSLEFVLGQLTNVLSQSKLVVAHNMNFDENVIASEYYRCNLKNPLISKIKICTMACSINFCALHSDFGYKWPNLSELHYKLFNFKMKETHNASVDVRLTARCFFELIKLNIICL